MPIMVEQAQLCWYCTRRESHSYCPRCRRVLCEQCRDGLQCSKSKCWSRPDGGGVR